MIRGHVASCDYLKSCIDVAEIIAVPKDGNFGGLEHGSSHFRSCPELGIMLTGFAVAVETSINRNAQHEQRGFTWQLIS